MTISLYQISAPVVAQMLAGLSGVLEKAAAFAAEKKLDPQALLTARFAPDMYDLAKQVRVVCMWATVIAGKLSGSEPPKFADDEKTFEELRARVAKAIAFVNAQDPAAIDAAAGKVIAFPVGPAVRKFKGLDFTVHFALPHFMFHCATCYDLLRHSGAPLAKRDYMGPVHGMIEG